MDNSKRLYPVLIPDKEEYYGFSKRDLENLKFLQWQIVNKKRGFGDNLVIIKTKEKIILSAAPARFHEYKNIPEVSKEE